MKPSRVIACTATATPIVRREIQERLGLRAEQSAVILRGFSRPNLHLAVVESDNSTQRRKLMLRALRDALGNPDEPKGAPLFTQRLVGTRKKSQRPCPEKVGVPPRITRPCGVGARGRQSAFREWFPRCGGRYQRVRMGIDRADIRTVVHVQAPGSVEAYYQEVGAQGATGNPRTGSCSPARGTSGFGGA